MPAYQWKPIKKPLNVESEENLCFAKLLAATPDQVLNIIDSEKKALLKQMAEDGNESLEGSYVAAALGAIEKRKSDVEDRMEAASGILKKIDEVKCDEEDKDNKKPEDCSENKDDMAYSSATEGDKKVLTDDTVGGEDSFQKSDEEAYGDSTIAVINEPDENVSDTVTVEEVAEDLAIPQAEGITTKKENSAFYFYQASDGQHIYMHSVNARCLVKEYGKLELCPPEIQANIVEAEAITMSEELRRRLRYLNHLPLKCEFQVVELVLKPPIISKETLAQFTDEIDRRRKLRLKKSRDERRKLKMMQEEENRKMENCPALRASLGGIQNHNFEEMRSVIVPSEAPVLGAVAGSSGGSSPLTTPIGSPPYEKENDGSQTTGLSFAQMLRAGKAQTSNVWGSKPPPSVKAADKQVVVDSESDSEDRIPIPTYQQSFGDAIQAALENAETGSTSGKSGGKKKKKTKKLLFTTTMTRAK